VLRITRYHHREAVHCFRAQVSAPRLTLASAELERAEWFPLDGLPAERQPLLDAILADAARPA
jgi:hypothetical protein